MATGIATEAWFLARPAFWPATHYLSRMPHMPSDPATEYRDAMRRLREQVKLLRMAPSEALAKADTLLAQFRTKGFRPSTDMLNAHLQLTDNLQGSFAVRDSYLRSGVRCNTTTFNVLMGRCNTFREGEQQWGEMCRAGHRPNAHSLNALISLCSNAAEAEVVLGRMEPYHIVPITPTWNALLALANSDRERGRTYDRMLAAGCQPNEVTLNTLVSRAADHATAMRWLGTLSEARVLPGINTFVTLLKKAETKAERLATDAARRKHGCSTNEPWNRLWDRW